MECYILTFHIADFLINKSHGVIRYGNAVLSKQPTNIFIWKHVTNAVRDFSSFSCQSLTADSEVLNHGGSKSVLWLGCIPTGNEICVNWQQSASYCDGTNSSLITGKQCSVSGVFFNCQPLAPPSHVAPPLSEDAAKRSGDNVSWTLPKKKKLWCTAREQNFDKMSWKTKALNTFSKYQINTGM